MNRADSKANQHERSWIQHVLVTIYRQTLRRGFHGKATLTLTIQDGTIQHTTHAVEQNHRRPD